MGNNERKGANELQVFRFKPGSSFRTPHVYNELLRFGVWLASHVAIYFVPIMVCISVELAFQSQLTIMALGKQQE